MEILTKQNLVRRKPAPTAVSRTFTPLLRRIRFPYQGFSFLNQTYMEDQQTWGLGVEKRSRILADFEPAFPKFSRFWADVLPICFKWMRFFLLTVEVFLLTVRLFTYGGGTVSKKDQTQFSGQGEP